MRDSEKWYRKREGKNALCNWRKTQSWCFSKAEKCVSCKHFLPVIWVHNSFPEWWLWKNSPIGKVTFSIQRSSRKTKKWVCPFFLFISGSSLPEAFLITWSSDLSRDGYTKKARSFDVQGNPQVVSIKRLPYLFYIPACSLPLVGAC